MYLAGKNIAEQSLHVARMQTAANFVEQRCARAGGPNSTLAPQPPRHAQTAVHSLPGALQ